MNNNDQLVPHIFELFQYNAYCNLKLIDVITVNQSTCSEKTILLLNHTLNAHHIWNARINNVPNTFGVWQVHEPEQLLAIDEDNKTATDRILSGTHLSTFITYHNMKGESFTNTIADILFHIINHSTYHRGQIQSELKLAGITPESLDYIFYKRNKL